MIVSQDKLQVILGLIESKLFLVLWVLESSANYRIVSFKEEGEQETQSKSV